MQMGTPTTCPSIITHHAERPAEGKRSSYLAEEEDVHDDDTDARCNEGQRSRNLLVTFDDGTTTETQGSVATLLDDKLSVEEAEENETQRREESRKRRRRKRRSRSQSMEEEEEESITVVDDETMEQPPPPHSDAVDAATATAAGNPKTKTVTKTTTTTSTKKTSKRTTTPSPHLTRKALIEPRQEERVAGNRSAAAAAAAASEFDGRVRIVPIMLPDGTMLRRDPDETVEVKTEFTNYCHQEYADGKGGAKDDAAIIQSLIQKTAPKPKKEAGQIGDGADKPPATNGNGIGDSTPTGSTSCSSERVVPITLSNGDKFIPTFTRLADLEPPDWSAFGSPSRNNDGGLEAGGRDGAESARMPPGRDDQKTVVPIHVVGEPNRGGRSTQRKQEQRWTSAAKEDKDDLNWAKKSANLDGGGKTIFGGKSETREREEDVEATRTKNTLTTTDRTTRRTEQKKVQHTVRFDIDEKNHGSGGGEGRSSSLESHFRAPPPPPSPAPKPARERHRSGGGISLKNDPNTERTLRDIDKDIHKIWRELQQLDSISVSPAANSNPAPTRGATAVRKASPPSPSQRPQATAVKIRTFTTPTPQVAPFMRSTPPPSPKFSDLRARDRRSDSGTPPPPLRRITPPPPQPPPSLSSFGTPPFVPANRSSSPPSPPYTPATKTCASVHSPPPPSPRSALGRAGAPPASPQWYTPRRDMEPTRPGAIHSVRVSSSTWSRPPMPPSPAGSRAVSSPHYQHHPHPAEAATAAAAGSSFRSITLESSNGPFGAQSSGGSVADAARAYSALGNGSAGRTELSHALPLPPSLPPPSHRFVAAGDAPHRLEKMVEECDSIPYADEEGSRAVMEGARATLREARPLSALVDQSTQTVAAGERKNNNRVTFSHEKNGSAAAAPAEGGSKCAVQ